VPTREDLIDLCERGVVPHDRWHNRDSSGAQRQLGECLALLRAGCEFEVARTPESTGSTWWIEVWFRGFDAFEYGERHESNETFYVPTKERLEGVNGGDWY
jgi:hypothetical protein